MSEKALHVVRLGRKFPFFFAAYLLTFSLLVVNPRSLTAALISVSYINLRHVFDSFGTP